MWYQEAYTDLKPKRCPMPVPIICLDQEICQFAERFRELFSKPQYQYFVTVLLGLMECEGNRTLTGRLASECRAAQFGRTESFFVRGPMASSNSGRQMAEALSRRDAAAGHSRLAATAPRTTEASRSSQATRRDRVLDRGRLDDPEAQRQEDGRTRGASFDDRGEACAGS